MFISIARWRSDPRVHHTKLVCITVVLTEDNHLVFGLAWSTTWQLPNSNLRLPIFCSCICEVIQSALLLLRNCDISVPIWTWHASHMWLAVLLMLLVTIDLLYQITDHYKITASIAILRNNDFLFSSWDSITCAVIWQLLSHLLERLAFIPGIQGN